MITISVIIPVYNKEKYISICLDSVLAQSLEGIEIVCVDDGSTDSSLEIINEYKIAHKCIKVIAQENIGVGFSRNRGIQEASGEYIAFMDPDDYYPDEDVLKDLYDNAKKYNVDICGGSFSSLKNGSVLTEYKGLFEGYVFHEDKMLDYYDYQYDYGFQRFIYSRQLIIHNNLYFPNYIRFQDPPFFVRTMIVAKRFFAMKRVTYRYRESYKEIEWNLAKKIDLLNGYKSVVSVAKHNNLTSLQHLEYDRITSEYIRAILLSGNSYAECLIISDKLEQICSQFLPEVNIELLYEMVQNLRKEYSKHQCIISVIVPVYNVSEYLEECIDSLLSQRNVENFEIICVDDGSTDNSGAICDNYAQKDDRVIVIHKQNGGLSSARNAGAEIAHGELLYFLDSDDYLSTDALSELSNLMMKNDLEAIYFDAEVFFENIEIQKQNPMFIDYYRNRGPPNVVMTGPSLLKKFLESDKYRTPVQLCMISREYYDRISLENYNGILHEDNLFTFFCVLNSNRVMYVNKPYYHRRIRGNSIMTSNQTFKNVYGYLKCCREMDWWIYNNKTAPFEAHILLDKTRNTMRAIWDNLSVNEKSKYARLTLPELAEFAIGNVVCRQTKEPVVNVFYIGDATPSFRTTISNSTLTITLDSIDNIDSESYTAPVVAIIPNNISIARDGLAKAITTMYNLNVLSISIIVDDASIKVFARKHEYDESISITDNSFVLSELQYVTNGSALDIINNDYDDSEKINILDRMVNVVPRYKKILIDYLFTIKKSKDALQYMKKWSIDDRYWFYRYIDALLCDDDKENKEKAFMMIKNYARIKDYGCSIRYGKLALDKVPGFTINSAIQYLNNVNGTDNGEYCRILADLNYELRRYDKFYTYSLLGANTNNAYCVGRVARCYRDGLGVSPDIEKSSLYYVQAYSMNCSWAKKELLEILPKCDTNFQNKIYDQLYLLGDFPQNIRTNTQSEDVVDDEIQTTISIANSEYEELLEDMNNINECDTSARRIIVTYKEALSGNANSMQTIGFEYKRGEILKKNLNKSAYWMGKAFLINNKWVNEYLETLWEISDSESITLIKEICNLEVHRNNPIVIRMMARINIVSNNVSAAKDYYRMALKINPELVVCEYTTLLYNLGGKDDLKECYYICKQFSQQNNKDALFRLGKMYAHGRGVKKNKRIAKELLIKSRDLGSNLAVDELSELATSSNSIFKRITEKVVNND